MEELLEILAGIEIPSLVLCAVAVVILDVFALAVILAASRESALCRRRWQKVSACIELRHGELHYPLEADEILLGRHISADIRLSDPSVSRYHAVMTVTGGVWSVTDLDSRSGTYVNERRVHTARLRPGDCVRLGNARLYVDVQPQNGGRRRRKGGTYV